MKTIIIIVAFILVTASLTEAQILAQDSSYAHNDTTAWAKIEPGPQTLWVWFKDSANVTITLQFGKAGMPAAVCPTYAVVSDSTNSTTPEGYFKGYQLRAGATNNIPGAEWVRLIVLRKTTKNGVTTPTFDAGINHE